MCIPHKIQKYEERKARIGRLFKHQKRQSGYQVAIICDDNTGLNINIFELVSPYSRALAQGQIQCRNQQLLDVNANNQALRNLLVARQNVEQRTLASTRWSHYGGEFSRPEASTDALQNGLGICNKNTQN